MYLSIRPLSSPSSLPSPSLTHFLFSPPSPSSGPPETVQAIISSNAVPVLLEEVLSGEESVVNASARTLCTLCVSRRVPCDIIYQVRAEVGHSGTLCTRKWPEDHEVTSLPSAVLVSTLVLSIFHLPSHTSTVCPIVPFTIPSLPNTSSCSSSSPFPPRTIE